LAAACGLFYITMSLTKSQQEAVNHDGHLLIIAGPGSGKTTTTVAKARRILSDPTRNLVMVTFTKEGAEEMRRRLDKAQADAGLPPFHQSRLRIGTFHSIALQHLYTHRKRPKILSPAQQSIILNEALSPYSDDQELVKEIRQEFESYMYVIDRSNLTISPAAQRVINRYLERLESSRATDLYHVMRECSLSVKDGGIPVLGCTDMLVDEGQDTDDLQRTWIFAHAAAGIRTTIVADDDQSIYEWRNALGYQGLRAFLDTFQAHQIYLSDNYRSRSEILAHAVTLIQFNKNRLAKRLVAKRGPGGQITSYTTVDSAVQSEELAELMSQTPEQHQNAVVLARKGRSLNDMEMELTKLGIAYTRIGKSIWDDTWVATYLTLLQSLLDGSPVGIFGCLSCIGLDEQVRIEVLRALGGSAEAFFNDELPDLESATKTDMESLKDFSQSCSYWRTQLGKGSINEVIMDTGSWLSGKQRSHRTKFVIERASNILASVRGSLSARLMYVTRNKRKDGNAPVTLMTMHASKGLEFETVHVIDANKPDDLSDLVHVEAERRLMYVAMTRAKDRCVVWYSGTPHPTLAEAGLPVARKLEDLRKLFTA
jgi:superfamily I DNA/RNA helicase